MSGRSREYNQDVKLVALLVAALALAGCNRGVESKEAVRQAVIDHLSTRTNLNMASMNVDVTSVSFKGDEADATVAFSPKGAGGSAQGMTMRYTLERKGNRWVVKGRADSGGHGGGMGGGAMGGSPHGSEPPAMPPEHPPVKGGEKKQ